MIVRVGPNGAKGDFGYLIAQASSLRFLYSADAATDIGPLTSQTGASQTINSKSASKPAARVSGKIVSLSTGEKTRNGMVAELLRQNPTLDDLRQVAAHCKACDL